MATVQRLFRGPVSAVHVSAHFEIPQGWSATVLARRDGELWSDSDREHYHCLTTDELVDVLQAELELRLRGPAE